MPPFFRTRTKTGGEEESHDIRAGENASPSQGPDPTTRDTQGDTVQRYGLSVVGVAGSSDIVDVVFVHGLMGTPSTTWTNTKEKFFWPAHITEDVPRVRVLTFGYDASPANLLGRVGQNNLGDHARDLLSDMARKREETATEDRPIVWIAHSLGGLVVEKALIIGDESSDLKKHLKDIASNTRGMITLGTPHSGSSLAEWADLTSQLLRSVHTNKNIVKVLKADSEVLRDANAAFGDFLARRKDRDLPINITTFHENLPISNIGVVVSKASASIFGYPGESIQGNHMVRRSMPSLLLC
jgi:pimeloyl-ACP methyl ester carboxylesterase